MIHIIVFLCGVLASVGLGLSEMTRPAKVLGLLNVMGEWDPSLLVVMASGLTIYALGNYLIRRVRSKPLLHDSWGSPDHTDITRSLVIGSACFGLGWGITGFCPGPITVSIVTGIPSVLIFTLAMMFGLLFSFVYNQHDNDQRLS